MNIAVDKLTPGMELAADVFNVNRGLLLGQGTVLTERHLRIFKTWGIERVQIVGGGLDPAATAAEPALPAAAVQAATAEVERLFRFVPDTSPGIRELRSLAIERGARQLARQAAPPAAADR